MDKFPPTDPSTPTGAASVDLHVVTSPLIPFFSGGIGRDVALAEDTCCPLLIFDVAEVAVIDVEADWLKKLRIDDVAVLDWSSNFPVDIARLTIGGNLKYKQTTELTN